MTIAQILLTVSLLFHPYLMIFETHGLYSLFVIASLAFIASAIFFRPSVFVVVLAFFLSSGFLLKSLLHTTLGTPFIEPTGSFSGSVEEWNCALGFATAGLAGATIAVLIASLIPAISVGAPLAPSTPLANVLVGLLSLLMLAAVAVYFANYELTILRIGYRPQLILSSAPYGVFAFAVTWGLLLACLSVAFWLLELHRVPHVLLVYVGSILGFLGAVSMGSRVQFLLYMLASAATIMQSRRAIINWKSIALGSCGAVILFGLSLLVVMVERMADFHPLLPTVELKLGGTPRALTEVYSSKFATPTQVPITKPTPSFAEKLHRFYKLEWSLDELRTLVVMRWIGLEGVMVAAGNQKELGASLFARALAEEPGEGTHAIYQRMAGDKYIDVKHFTFLTIPGVIGFGSYTGSYPGIALFTFFVVVLGHLVEKFAAQVTKNSAAASVSGVALAYLVAQFNVPWTLIVFIGELLLALSALALLRQFFLLWRPATDQGVA